MAIPKRYLRFMTDYPEIGKAYEAMGKACHDAGPLDDKTRALVKLAISSGARMEGAVHSHTRKAIKAGCTEEEIRHVALMTLPTIGFPNMMAVMSWIEDVFEKQKEKGDN